MTCPPTTTELLDPLADLDGEDLACLGLRRADDGPLGEFFRELRKERYEDFLASLPQQPPKPSKPRKPSIATLIQQAEKSGRRVTSITTPDGTKLTFTEPETTGTTNPWDAAAADLRNKKAPRQ